MGSLSNKQVGKFINENFIATFKKVGTFRIQNGIKIGGNVVSYFLTPDGRVISAVGGPVQPEMLLKEAKWAHKVWEEANKGLEKEKNSRLKNRKIIDRVFCSVKDRMRKASKVDYNYMYYKHTYYFEDLKKMHHVIANGLIVMFKESLPHIDSVYEKVFMAVGEKVSDQDVIDDGKNPRKKNKMIEDLQQLQNKLSIEG